MRVLKNIYQIDAFTDKLFQGNSAAVVYCEEELLDTEMLQIAKEMNLSETAFISLSARADFKLKWFTPSVEVKLCGHATIASLHYLKERELIKEYSTVTFETLSGIIECGVVNDLYFMKLPIPEFQEFKGDYNGILSVLGVDRQVINDNYPFILQDNGNLFIYILSLDVIKNLKPNFKEMLKLINEKLEYTEVTVFSIETTEEESDAHLRFFAPYYGIDEDPVTGSANGPLLMVLRKLGLVDLNTEGKIFTFEQGDELGRTGRVKVEYSPIWNELKIYGNAVTVMKGDIFY